MKKTILINARIVAEEEILENGYLIIHDEKIYQIGNMASCPNIKEYQHIIDCEKIDWVLPGMIDIHIHGVGGSDVMDATTDSLNVITRLLPKEGTTSFLATTLTNPEDIIEAALKNVAAYIMNHNKCGQAEVLGIHLEGPFIDKNYKGAQSEEDIIPVNINLLKRWQDIAHNHIRLVTLAPELDKDHTVLHYLREIGVVSSMGHTNATFQEVKKAVSSGLSHVTHLFNGMRGLHHREPGAAGAALLLDELTVEIITDGIHIHPELMKLVYRAKGPENIILITDSIRAKCLKNGVYDLGGQEVDVKDGKAWLRASSSLAGSVLKLHKGRRNLEKWLNIGVKELVKMTSATPAKRLGIYDRKGSITENKDADLVLLNNEGEVVQTICRGQVV